MFTCSIGDEIFGTHETDQSIIDDFQKTTMRCKKLEKELAKTILSKARAESQHIDNLEALKNYHERQIHEINAEHAIQISNITKATDLEMDALCNRIEYLENIIETHMKSELEFVHRVVLMKSLLLGSDMNLMQTDYMHIDNSFSNPTPESSVYEDAIKIIKLSKDGAIHQCNFSIRNMISALLEDVSGKVLREIESRKACEREFELLVTDYNEAQREIIKVNQKVSHAANNTLTCHIPA